MSQTGHQGCGCRTRWPQKHQSLNLSFRWSVSTLRMKEKSDDKDDLVHENLGNWQNILYCDPIKTLARIHFENADFIKKLILICLQHTCTVHSSGSTVLLVVPLTSIAEEVERECHRLGIRVVVGGQVIEHF